MFTCVYLSRPSEWTSERRPVSLGPGGWSGMAAGGSHNMVPAWHYLAGGSLPSQLLPWGSYASP